MLSRAPEGFLIILGPAATKTFSLVANGGEHRWLNQAMPQTHASACGTVTRSKGTLQSFLARGLGAQSCYKRGRTEVHITLVKITSSLWASVSPPNCASELYERFFRRQVPHPGLTESEPQEWALGICIFRLRYHWYTIL